MKPIIFANQNDFRKWLKKYYDKESELVVGFYKVSSSKPSMTWSESVDQALCFGWIDGVTRSIDQESYCIRFTPRRATSIWSAVNIKKIANLTKQGLMMPAGLKAFELRKETRMGIYSHENDPVDLSPEYQKLFKKNKEAWKFFISQAPSYKKVMIHWIMNAKQEKTRLSRLEKTIAVSEQQKRME